MLDTVFNLLKVSAIVAVCAVFTVAIYNLLNLINTLVFGGFVSEFFSLVSMYLPFNANSVFNAIAVSITAILSFMIARKIFDLTSWSISAV